MQGRRLNASSPVNWSHPLNRGRLAWWLAHPALPRGGKWFDLCGLSAKKATNGVLTNGPAWSGSKGRPGGAGSLNFDASNDYVDLASAALLTSGRPFTMAWWERVTSTSGVFPSRFRLVVSGAAREFAVIRTDVASYTYVAFGMFAVGGLRATVPSITSSVGTWNRVVLVGDVSPTNTTIGNWRAYTNGFSATVASGGPFSDPGTNTVSRIGYDNIDDGANVAMDDICIWSRALSAGEVAAEYKQSLRGHPDTLNWVDL